MNGRSTLAGKLVHVDPHDVGDFAKADLNAAFRVSGTIGAPPAGRAPQVFRVVADVHVDPSRVAGRPLAGTIVGTVDGAIAAQAPTGRSPVTFREVSGARIALDVGANHLTADGDFGRVQDRLRLAVDAPRLADFGVGLSGVLKGDGFLGGTLNEPAVDFTIVGDDLRYARRAASVATPTATAVPTVPREDDRAQPEIAPWQGSPARRRDRPTRRGRGDRRLPRWQPRRRPRPCRPLTSTSKARATRTT